MEEEPSLHRFASEAKMLGVGIHVVSQAVFGLSSVGGQRLIAVSRPWRITNALFLRIAERSGQRGVPYLPS